MVKFIKNKFNNTRNCLYLSFNNNVVIILLLKNHLKRLFEMIYIKIKSIKREVHKKPTVSYNHLKQLFEMIYIFIFITKNKQ